jgi:hypothetical protein
LVDAVQQKSAEKNPLLKAQLLATQPRPPECEDPRYVQIAAVGLDHLRPSESSRLRSLQRVIVTPHIAQA